MESELILLLEKLSILLSFLTLFMTLWWYKYEIMYRSLLVIIAFLGFWWPVLHFVPYGLILWRVYIGANVTTQSKMFIGQHIEGTVNESNDPSNASTHWIVAIEKRSDFLYTHAVGQVISGKGIKKPFKWVSSDYLKKNYTLTHVGYVTRKNTQQKMEEVVDLEPMISGNTCQEFAVDIAFQLSSSRTFTFMKTMTILRVRTVVFYTLICLSVVMYITKLHWIARILNAIVLLNVFVAMELSRIGVHNTAQQGYLPVVKAYFRYPKPVNFLQILLLSLAIFVLYHEMGLVKTASVAFVVLIVISMKA